MAQSMDSRRAEPDLDQALRLALELMVIPGVSGHESLIMADIRRRLKKVGVPASWVSTDSAHKRSRFGGEVGNLIVKLPGTVRAPRRLFSAHVDTVPNCVGCIPVREGDLIISAAADAGLSADDRAGTAVVLNTLLEVVGRNLAHPPLTFLFTVQEEFGLRGAEHVAVSKLGRPAIGFNFDGGSGITTAATGAYRMKIGVRGISAHAGGAPHEGVSTATIVALAIADLHERGWLGAVRKGRQRGTSNFGVVEAGIAVNVVPDSATVLAEVRSHSPAFRRRMLGQFRKAFERAAGRVKNEEGQAGAVSFEHRLDYESFALTRKSPPVVAPVKAHKELGIELKYRVADGGVDANWLTAHGIPTVSLASGSRQAHTTEADLEVSRFEQACRVALRLATELPG